MSIQEIPTNFKRLLANGDALTAILLIIVGISSFFLGRASVGEVGMLSTAATLNASAIQTREPGDAVQIRSDRVVDSNVEDTDLSNAVEGGYVASKSGTKYHLPWCGSAKQIKEENKIWFATKEEAEGAGYSPAANCKGI